MGLPIDIADGHGLNNKTCQLQSEEQDNNVFAIHFTAKDPAINY